MFIKESTFIGAPRNGLCGQVWVPWSFNVALSNIFYPLSMGRFDGIGTLVWNLNWAKTSLGGITRKHFKDWLRNHKRTNHFLGPFTLNVFTTTIFFFMFINCKH
jgi:hypothetical protein